MIVPEALPFDPGPAEPLVTKKTVGGDSEMARRFLRFGKIRGKGEEEDTDG